ncbi:hypothetical protein EIP91_005503 [Steccherinum ochraceum]|uniref:Uncharacterized protein n=1 Tax=Steccherinum ochraceum TaxID=92696 RepID=A0A4V2MXX1_9APHY|nr:hypothetical protein EIP91_005503 [Steccherinum ochraceum]
MAKKTAVATPEKPPAVRVTYSGRRKQRRESNANATDRDSSSSSDSDSALSSSDEEHAPATSPKLTIKMKPKPTIDTAATTPATKSSTNGNTTPARPPASRASATPSTSRVKPLSTVSTAAPQSPRESVDDNASNAGPKFGTRKTEAERISFIKEDPHCGDVEPFRAFCKKCSRWIPLHNYRRYVMKNWAIHRKSDCKTVVEFGDEPRSPTKTEKTETPSATPKTPAPSSKAQKTSTPKAAPSSTPQSIPVPPMTPIGAAKSPSTAMKPPSSASQPLSTTPSFSPAYVLPVAYTTRPLSTVYPSTGTGSPVRHAVPGAPLSTPIPLPAFNDLQEAKKREEARIENEERRKAALVADPVVGEVQAHQTHKLGCKPTVETTRPSSSFTFWFPSAVFGSSEEAATTPAPPESSSGSEFSDDDDIRDDDEKLGPKAIKPWFLEPEEKRDPRNLAFRNELQNDPQVWWYNRWNVMCNACGRAAVAMMGTPEGEEQRCLVRNWRGHKVICDAAKPQAHQAPAPSSWLAKLWPYGRSGEASPGNGSASAAPSRSAYAPANPRKRGREDDEEGEAMQNGRAVRPRQDAAAGGGLWRRLSQSVVGLFDGVRAGYAAASATTMEE